MTIVVGKFNKRLRSVLKRYGLVDEEAIQEALASLQGEMSITEALLESGKLD